jgi:hypothetical protein
VNKYAAVHAVSALLYNTAPIKLAMMMFPDAHPSYLEEWVERFAQGFHVAVSKMDTDNFRRFVDMAVERHGNNALRYHPDPIDTDEEPPRAA